VSVKLKNTLLGFLIFLFVGITVGFFIPTLPVIPLFSLYLVVILGIQVLNYPSLAFALTALSAFWGVFCITRVDSEFILAIPVLIIALFSAVFLLHVHLQKISQRFKQSRYDRDDIENEKKLIDREISFYEERLRTYSRHADQRRVLVKAAREMGSLLDPGKIQEKLVEMAQILFPGKPVQISYGQTGNPIDQFVIQKRQSILVPDGPIKGDPLMASPICSQRAVAGILHVGGHSDSPFNRDDLRLLDILASLATLALDNTLLFQHVKETALRDGLTGLLTHRAFQDHLEEQILEASRFEQPMSVILMDVDHFKSVNDTHGHQAGDQVLQGVSHVLVRQVREVDIVSRYGGEEFVVLLLQTPHHEAVQIAEEMRRDLESQEFDVGRTVIRVSGSFGVASFPSDATSSQQLMRHADQRLYRAKTSGRNRVIGSNS
jgi:diguanylate cyclase (GGDEF)-like protein